jgi:hypothetical protein
MTYMIKFDDKTLDDNMPTVIAKLAAMSTIDLGLLRAAEDAGKTRQGVLDAVDLELHRPARFTDVSVLGLSSAANIPPAADEKAATTAETSQFVPDPENKNILLEMATAPVPAEFYDDDGNILVISALIEILAAHLPAAQQLIADQKEALTEEEAEQALDAADKAMRDERDQIKKDEKSRVKALEQNAKAVQLKIDVCREGLAATELAVDPEDRALFREPGELVMLLSNGDHFHPDMRFGMDSSNIIKTSEGISFGTTLKFDGDGPAFDIAYTYLFRAPKAAGEEIDWGLALRCEIAPPLKTGKGAVAQIPAGSLFFRT